MAKRNGGSPLLGALLLILLVIGLAVTYWQVTIAFLALAGAVLIAWRRRQAVRPRAAAPSPSPRATLAAAPIRSPSSRRRRTPAAKPPNAPPTTTGLVQLAVANPSARRRWAAIDFETANMERASACAVGLALVDDDKVIAHGSWLIRPHELRFLPQFVDMHGITPELVAGEPEFDRVWGLVSPHLVGRRLLAHNADFDREVLAAECQLYRIPQPRAAWYCTVELSRAAWPELYNHKLPTVCRHVGIALDHHDASSDAWACAQIALAACSRLGLADLGGSRMARA